MEPKNKPEVRSDIDKIYSAVIADSEALEDAKMTLEVIKETDPGVYDEMINDTLSLIRKALSNSVLGVLDKLVRLEANQNPYGYVWFTHYMEMRFTRHRPNGIENVGEITPVYAAPFQREWTDEEFIAEAVKRGHYTVEEKKTPVPVAWMHTSAAGNVYFRKKPHDKVFNPQPVYLTSSPREWVDLTHEEIIDCMDTPTWLGTLLAIQDKIKEKNI